MYNENLSTQEIKRSPDDPGPDNGSFDILDQGGRVIGQAFRQIGPNRFTDAEVNARLWSVAPDLLRACNLLVHLPRNQESARATIGGVVRDLTAWVCGATSIDVVVPECRKRLYDIADARGYR